MRIRVAAERLRKHVVKVKQVMAFVEAVEASDRAATQKLIPDIEALELTIPV